MAKPKTSSKVAIAPPTGGGFEESDAVKSPEDKVEELERRLAMLGGAGGEAVQKEEVTAPVVVEKPPVVAAEPEQAPAATKKATKKDALLVRIYLFYHVFEIELFEILIEMKKGS